MDSELKELMEGLKREIQLLRDLVKAKDDLIQALKFAPAPVLTLPYPQFVQPLHIPYQAPSPFTPPFVITSDTLQGNPDKGFGGVINCDNGTGEIKTGLFLVNNKAK